MTSLHSFLEAAMMIQVILRQYPNKSKKPIQPPRWSPAPHHQAWGTPVTFTATVVVILPGVGTPTGNVEFSDGGVNLGTGSLGVGGQATLTTTLLSTGAHTISATYVGDANFDGSTAPGITQVVEGPPSVTMIDSNADTGDGQILEDEYTLAAITQLRVVFNKTMNADTASDLGDATNPLNYSLMRDGTVLVTLNNYFVINPCQF